MGSIYMGDAPLLPAAHPAWVCTPRALASAGASLTLAVRDGEQGEAVAADVCRGLANPHVRAMAMDPSGLACVHRFATDWGGAPLHMTVDLGIVKPTHMMAVLGASEPVRVPRCWRR